MSTTRKLVKSLVESHRQPMAVDELNEHFRGMYYDATRHEPNAEHSSFLSTLAGLVAKNNVVNFGGWIDNRGATLDVVTAAGKGLSIAWNWPEARQNRHPRVTENSEAAKLLT